MNNETDAVTNSNDKPQSGIALCDPRVQLATERTLLAWVRTGLALMAFGFVVARFSLILHSLGIKTNPMITFAATMIGIFMVVLGVVANAGSSFHYRNYFRNLMKDGETPFAAWSLAVWVALASAIIGVMLAIYLVAVDFTNWPMVAGSRQP